MTPASLDQNTLTIMDRLLAAGRQSRCTLIGAYVHILEQCDWINTQEDVATAINEALGTRYDRRYISDLLNDHKRPTRALEDLARRELLEYLLPDDRSAQLIELLGLQQAPPTTPQPPADTLATDAPA